MVRWNLDDSSSASLSISLTGSPAHYSHRFASDNSQYAGQLDSTIAKTLTSRICPNLDFRADLAHHGLRPARPSVTTLSHQPAKAPPKYTTYFKLKAIDRILAGS